MRRTLIVVILTVLVVSLTAGCASSPEEESSDTGETVETGDEAFYEGETIEMIVATKPGGGYDTYGRMVAKFMEEQLPGSTIVVRNVPGAGHILGANAIYEAEPNGLTFGTFNRALPLSQIAGLEGIEFDLSEMSWLGSPSDATYALIMSTQTPYTDLDAVVEASDDVRLSSAGVGSQAHVTGLLFGDMMDMDNLKVVPGYMGGEGEMAIQRGEVDGMFASWASLLPLVEDGHATPVMFIGEEAPEGYEDVPLIQDVVTDEKWQPVVNTLLTLNVLARPYAGPPGIPEDRLTTLQEAFANAVQSSEFAEMAEKLDRPINYVSGERAEELVLGLQQLSPEVKEKIRAAYSSE